MTTFVLLSEIHRLAPVQLNVPDLHIICDDGTWPPDRITRYINQWQGHSILHADAEDWSRYDGELL